MTRLVDLTPEALSELPAACRGCLFWEVADAPRGPVADAAAGAAAKEAAWQATQLEWGSAGKAAYASGELIGYAVFGPPEHVPRVRRLGWSASEDAVILATIWVHPDRRGEGVGRALLQAALSETHRRGGRALEAVGSRPPWPSDPCMLPTPFLLANGFTVLHNHGRHPMLRLDLSQTVRWSLPHAVDVWLERLGRRVGVRRPALGASHSEVVRPYETRSVARGDVSGASKN